VDASAGVKFNDADLIGLPLRITLSPRSLEKDSIEVKRRDATESELVPFADFPERLGALLGA
jgi:prolyl-tRNA synthetase